MKNFTDKCFSQSDNKKLQKYRKWEAVEKQKNHCNMWLKTECGIYI